MVGNHILLVFEGEKTEKQIHGSLTKYFLNESPETVVYGLYCANIYSLYHTIQKDGDLDLFSLLKENNKNDAQLEDLTKDNVSEIYLFFDYDGHDPSATEEKLAEMLSLFNEETENGKLYISYPMVEAIKHIKGSVDFKDTKVPAKVKIGYKELVDKECDGRYKDLAALSLPQWNNIISEHCKKMNFIVNDSFTLPDRLIIQDEIFSSQVEKYINPSNEVSALSSFPIFIVDYYGCKHIKLILSRGR